MPHVNATTSRLHEANRQDHSHATSVCDFQSYHTDSKMLFKPSESQFPPDDDATSASRHSSNTSCLQLGSCKTSLPNIRYSQA